MNSRTHRGLFGRFRSYVAWRANLFQSKLDEMSTLLGTAVSLQRDQLLLSDPKYRNTLCLARLRGRVYSQNDEDAVISEIFRRIGLEDKRFVEIGIEDGTQNTTRLLLETGWSGLWIEGSPDYAARARSIFTEFIGVKRLEVVNEFVSRENVSKILERSNIPTRFDYLSIDIDHNTSHVWRGLSKFRPRVICIEYNASYPPSLSFEVLDEPQRVWDGTNYFGASLKSLEEIGLALGYVLVGCDYAGVNAYFVLREEAQRKFLEPFTAEQHYEPPRYQAGILTGGHRPADRPPHISMPNGHGA